MTLSIVMLLFSFISLCRQCGTYVPEYQKYLLLSFLVILQELIYGLFLICF